MALGEHQESTRVDARASALAFDGVVGVMQTAQAAETVSVATAHVAEHMRGMRRWVPTAQVDHACSKSAGNSSPRTTTEWRTLMPRSVCPQHRSDRLVPPAGAIGCGTGSWLETCARVVIGGRSIRINSRARIAVVVCF
jgi:hypothetical protein